MNLVVVYNPKSGTALPRTELRRYFNANDIIIDRFIDITTDIESVEAAAKRNAVIAVIGGDGTIGRVASLVVSTHATLAPLPGGTLNHFTKDLGIPQNLPDAIVNLRGAKIHNIDVASVNDVIFVNNSSIGLYPSSLQIRAKLQNVIGKWPAAAVGAIESFLKYRTYTITINDRTFITPFVFIGNNDYHLGRAQVGRTVLDEGVLSVYVAACSNRWSLVQLIGYALIGKLYDHQDFHRQKVEKVSIRTTQKTLRVAHDGEITRLQTPIDYSILHKQLRILK